ncbi:MAG: hypothetical protein Kow00109_20300 [Acidobacteriota bacterium]
MRCASNYTRTQYRPAVAVAFLFLALGNSTVRAGTEPGQTDAPASPRQELLADFDWKFVLGDPEGAASPEFDDGAWRIVHLPHDWSIEGTPDPKQPTGSGGGYFPAGVGWYRKTFDAPERWRGRRVTAEFEGVYGETTVYLNGHRLGTHVYGYTSFHFDLTPYLRWDRPNVLAVRVDNSAQPNSRWYSGSGIYRHVRFVITDPVHVAHWGVFLSTPEVTPQRATVLAQIEVANDSTRDARIVVRTVLRDSQGRRAAEDATEVAVPAGRQGAVEQRMTVSNPALWSPDTPHLYEAVVQLRRGNDVVDEVTVPFGVRSLAWSAREGFLLNGRPIELAGGNVHHDHGPLGATAFDRAEERKVQLLKAAGFNAVRTAHNPPSPAFLEACDRLGLLVLEDAFDVWKAKKVAYDYGRFFEEWWENDLTAMVRRDRNHPSVVLWCIGNEIPDTWTPEGAVIAQRLRSHLRSLDPTRPITLSYPGTTSLPTAEAVFAHLDIVGYNYNLARFHADDHRRAPERIMVTTESFPADAFTEWELVRRHPHIIGEFVWTAQDYLGESGIGRWSYGTPEEAATARAMMAGMHLGIDRLFSLVATGLDIESAVAQLAGQSPQAQTGDEETSNALFGGYPWHAAVCGDLDLIGFRKPHSYYRDIVRNGGDRVYVTVRYPAPPGKAIIAVGWAVHPTAATWTWPGHEGEALEAEVYSAAERVRLYLNEQLIGEQPAGRENQFKAVFSVPYAPGTLKAEALRGGRVVAETTLTTAGEPTRLQLEADRSVVRADGQDLAFVTVTAVDAAGRPHPWADHPVTFTITGPGRIVAVGNADGRSDEPYQGNRRRLFQGRALVVVRTAREDGEIELTATAPGLEPAAVRIESKPAGPLPIIK